MYVSKVNIYHDKLYEDQKNTNKQSRVCADKKKEKYNYDMEAERKTGPKNMIIQMKEEKEKS
jgi:hypothetical protein